MKNDENKIKNDETWCTREKQKEQLMKKSEKNNVTWWTREKKQCKMMSKREKTLKNDEK